MKNAARLEPCCREEGVEMVLRAACKIPEERRGREKRLIHERYTRDAVSVSLLNDRQVNRFRNRRLGAFELRLSLNYNGCQLCPVDIFSVVALSPFLYLCLPLLLLLFCDTWGKSL